eukprot:286643-Rhodomonas_salina.3
MPGTDLHSTLPASYAKPGTDIYVYICSTLPASYAKPGTDICSTLPASYAMSGTDTGIGSFSTT